MLPDSAARSSRADLEAAISLLYKGSGEDEPERQKIITNALLDLLLLHFQKHGATGNKRSIGRT